MFSVYVIYNKDHDRIYIGQTKDLDERLDLHNKRTFRGFTSRFTGNWVVVHEEQFPNRKEALVREKQLKSFRGREFVRSKIKP